MRRAWSGVTGSLRARTARSPLAVLLAVAALLLPGAAGATQTRLADEKPPPLPSCFETGSGYGTCEGMIIPGGGSVSKVTVANYKDDFTLHGPAPLQHTKSVACGDAGCLYNHLDWSVYGATVVHGCQTNESTCVVSVAPGSSSWAVVYVRQNNDPKTLWAIWNSGKTEYKLSGTILASTCGKGTCTKKPTPASGITVTASGPGGGSDTTNAQGEYAITLPKGTYKVTPHSGTRPFDPAFKMVTLTHDQGDVDFTTCPVAELKGTMQRSSEASAASAICTPALKVTFEVAPERLVLKVGKDGNLVPGEETVKVIVTNTSKETVTGVRLLTLGAEPVDPTQQLDPIRFPGGTVPLKFAGSFAPKSHASRTFTLKVTGDGKYQFRSLALYDDPLRPGGNGRALGVGGKFESVAPLLSFQADIHRDNITQRNGADWIKGGTSWYVGGRLKNLSSHQSLCLAPLFADEDGNAISTGMQDVSQRNASVEEPPLAGLVKPGQSFPLGMLVRTSSTGGTQGSVDVDVKAFKAEPGASCQVKENGKLDGAGDALQKDELEIQEGSTSYVVHVDVSVNPDPTQRAGLLNFFGGFAKGSFDFYGGIVQTIGAVAKWAYNNPETYLKLVRASVGDPVAQADLLSRLSEHMMAASTLIVNYLEKVVPTTGDNPFEIAAKTWENVGNDAYAQISKASVEWSKHWTDELEHDYANGASEDIWRDYAGIAGEGVGQLQAIALQLFVEKLFAQMAATKASQLEAAANKATDAEKVITNSKGGSVVAGRVLSVADKEKGWGITESIAKKLRDIAEQFDVLIGARSRQAISVELEKLGAVLKNSNFHQKTVSAIDRAWLQMNVREGLLGFRSFTEEGKAYARKLIYDSSLKESQKLEALDRLNARIAENGADFSHMEELMNWEHRACRTCPTEKGWVNAGFNASDSGAAAGRTSTSRWRRFSMEETPIYGDGKLLGTEYVPYEESPNLAHLAKDPGAALPELCIRKLGTVLCPITGDIDLVYIVNKYGGSLTPDQMYKVFKALDDAGFAHTDLVTWVEQLTNNYYFPGKASQLEGLLPGEEACVQFAPDGIERATYLAALKQSIAISPNDYLLTILGGFHPDMR